MEREFKFRAWHETEKVMLFENRVGDCFNWFKEHQPVKIMQYTGHKDRKGNEVYQDDILRDDEATYRVIWCEESSGWDLLRLEDDNQIGGFGNYNNSFFKDFVSECRKIGTVYENHELLKHG